MWFQILCARLMTRAMEVSGNVGSRRPAAGKVSQTAHISSGDSTDALFIFSVPSTLCLPKLTTKQTVT